MFCISAALFPCGSVVAQERCRTEIKVLLSPAELSVTIAALHTQRESSGDVYFFDTDKRELLAQGVIVRLRRGSTASDLTVKLRPPAEKIFADPTGGRESFKCEVDLAANESNISYSIRNAFIGSQIPSTGNDLYRVLSEGQRKLLRAAQVSIDWNRVKRVSDIHATDWQITLGGPGAKLALELWEWPGGKILELSKKTGDKSSPAAYEELLQLRQLAIAKGLSLSADQRSKTRIVLESHLITTH